MKTNIPLEISKFLGFLTLGYWGHITYNSWVCAVALGMLGSAIISVTYRLSVFSD
jgi:hypothetical protein